MKKVASMQSLALNDPRSTIDVKGTVFWEDQNSKLLLVADEDGESLWLVDGLDDVGVSLDVSQIALIIPRLLQWQLRNSHPRRDGGATLKEIVDTVERYVIGEALSHHGGKVKEAAADLGLTRTGLNQMITLRHRALEAQVVTPPKGRPGHRQPASTDRPRF